MSRIVRGALLQARWSGAQESMIEKHEMYARQAADQGVQVICFQELFHGPYFCQVQDPTGTALPNASPTARLPRGCRSWLPRRKWC